MANWRNVGIVIDGQPIRVGGINPWQHEWHATDQPDIELPHPSYPNQRHRMSIYEIPHGTKNLVFAAGELSASVWGFYVPDDERERAIEMGNGRPYDHPLTDIINHRILTFSETADDLIRQIAMLIPPQKIDEYVNWQSPPPIAEFDAELRTTLMQLKENATEQTDEREPE